VEKIEKENKKFGIEVIFEYEGYLDYYRGHSHLSIPKDVVACVRFCVPITYLETLGDIILLILEDINSKVEPIEFLNDAEDNKDLQEQIEEFINDKNIEKAILEIMPEGVRPSDKFFDISDEEIEEIEKYLKETDYADIPYLIGAFHIWIEEE
jgi:hypothetical protein